MDNFELFGNIEQGKNFLESMTNGRFLFSFVISYTETCEIPGITFAGADIIMDIVKQLIKFQ
jgi:NaMN:DMB phosphoribosyltransferase